MDAKIHWKMYVEKSIWVFQESIASTKMKSFFYFTFLDIFMVFENQDQVIWN